MTWRMIIGLLAALSGVARAEHFNIELLAATPDGAKESSYADESPPAMGVNPRPVLRVRAGQTITVQFIMTNVYPHGVIPNAGIRYYVVKETALGQRTMPALDGNVVAQGTFDLDLKPKARIGGRMRVAVSQPGIYLLRVESLRTQNTHEHFSAIDLQVH
jgi:hypothetical protein